MTERQSKRLTGILDIVARETSIDVARLSALLSVSKVTIRKDIDLLREKGLLRREKGSVLSGDDINNRLTYHYDTKRRIAKKAAELVRDGEVVMIESGSCCALLAAELAQSKRDVTIITNSAFIAGYVRNFPGAKILLLGGDYQKDAQVLIGPVLRECVKLFSVDKFFIGTDGWTEETGFTGKDLFRVEAVRHMAERARRIMVVTESDKFRQQGVAALFPEAQPRVDTVITDEGIPPKSEAFLTAHNTTVLKAR